MEEVLKLLIGSFVLLLGIPIGDLISKLTKEELSSGKIYFKILVLIGLIGGLVGLVMGNDVLLFTMFFISIVTSRSLRFSSKINNKKKRKIA
jgi:hypothetical protein